MVGKVIPLKFIIPIVILLIFLSSSFGIIDHSSLELMITFVIVGILFVRSFASKKYMGIVYLVSCLISILCVLYFNYRVGYEIAATILIIDVAGGYSKLEIHPLVPNLQDGRDDWVRYIETINLFFIAFIVVLFLLNILDLDRIFEKTGTIHEHFIVDDNRLQSRGGFDFDNVIDKQIRYAKNYRNFQRIDCRDVIDCIQYKMEMIGFKLVKKNGDKDDQ